MSPPPSRPSSTDSSLDVEVRRFHALVRGRVQGVGYRATVAELGRRLRISGWVRNRHEGTVEVEAEGRAADLDAFVKFLGQGPPGAHVVGVDVTWSSATGTVSPFEVRKTA